MRFDVVTLFPELLSAFRDSGVLGRAVERGILALGIHDLRAWAGNRWKQVDDEPYGGGAGMVLQAPPVLSAVRALVGDEAAARVVMLTPRGRTFDQSVAEAYARAEHVILLCGRYEGIDERVTEILGPEELSVGDFVLGGGEVAAMTVIEAVARLIPGVVGDSRSVAEDSFTTGLLDYPAYTRPAEIEGRPVPQVLTSGNHEAIRRWRLERAVEATVTRRPDLIKKQWSAYSGEVRELVRRIAPELAGAE